MEGERSVCNGEYHDLSGTRFLQHFCTFGDGCSGRKDVVDQEDLPPSYPEGIPYGESSPHILFPLIRREFDLRDTVPRSDENFFFPPLFPAFSPAAVQ